MLKNLHAVLVHDQPDCVHDLVANLRRFDPDSDVLIYDGSGGPLRADLTGPLYDGVHFVPAPRRQRWGRTHDYILSCMDYFARGDWDALTVVDSDQLLYSEGYSAALTRFWEENGRARLGMVVPRTSEAHAESPWEGLQPILRQGVRSYREHPIMAAAVAARGWTPMLRWNFNPSTVYLRPAILALLRLLDVVGGLREEVLTAVDRVRVAEELYLGSLIGMLGFEARQYDFPRRVSWRTPIEPDDLPTMDTERVLWCHPVPRDMNDTIRQAIAARRVTVRDVA